jgi:microcystin-dependent protein
VTALSPLRPILNDTPASAIDVDWNFQTLEDYTATDVVKRDGSVAMEAPLNLLGPAPSLATHAVTKGYVDTNIIPIGTIWQFAGDTAPPAWAFCDYSEKSSTDPAWVPLFQVIGYKYGQNGTNFFLPDMRGRVPVGRSVGDALFGALGAKGGSRDLILPAHVHNIGNHYHGMKNHYHGLNGHTHYMNHQHDMANHQHLDAARAGYDINHAGMPGNTNAIYQPGGQMLSFSTRRTALMQSQEAGASTDWTGYPNNNTTGWGRDWTDGNSGASGGPSDNNTDWGGATDTDSRGVSPTNANVPPYTTINFIIRVG